MSSKEISDVTGLSLEEIQKLDGAPCQKGRETAKAASPHRGYPCHSVNVCTDAFHIPKEAF